MATWKNRVNDIEIMLTEGAWLVLCSTVRRHGTDTIRALAVHEQPAQEEEIKGAAIASAFEAAKTLSEDDLAAWQKDLSKEP